MIKLICSLVTFLVYNQLLQGQTTFLPIIKPDAEWYGRNTYCCPPGDENKRYKIESTAVLLQNKEYFRVLETDQKSGQIDKFKHVFIREADGKMWLWDTLSNDAETLMLDMDLKTGDTMSEGLSQFPGIIFYVTKTDTVTFLDGVPRKRIYINCRPDNPAEVWTTWVEGVGRMRGMFDQFSICLFDAPSFKVRCYLEDGKSVMESEDGKSCWYSVGTNDYNIGDLKISPNPSTSYISFELPPNAVLPLSYGIVNIDGRNIELGSYADLVNLQINISNLPSGIYFLTIQDKSGHVWRGKWVKQ